MNTIIVGTVKKINKIQTFTNKKTGKEFIKCEVIIDQNKNYKSALCIEFHQDNVDLVQKLEVDKVYEFYINASSNEWNDKYYTSVDCWRTVKLDQPNKQKAVPVGEEADLPF
tara:strand:+ start:286 stop:621 length:336 start_codon:yes stop_codon:yes gene_type:complete